MWAKACAFARLARFDRPIGTFLLLWPTLWAVWLASPKAGPDWLFVITFVSGVVLMRAAGCVINDIADRGIDGRVSRTNSRPLVSGLITTREALVFFAVLSLFAAAVAWHLNYYCWALAVMGIVMAISYPFTKRFFSCPQLVLGVTWSWGILMAFAQVQQQLPLLAWLLYLSNLLLTLAYDTIYAMVDREFDLQIGVNSSAILFGEFDRLIVGVLQIGVLTLLVAVGFLAKLAPSYFVILGLAGLLFVYQQYLIKDYDTQRCFKAFLNNNLFGLFVFLGILISR